MLLSENCYSELFVESRNRLYDKEIRQFSSPGLAKFSGITKRYEARVVHIISNEQADGSKVKNKKYKAALVKKLLRIQIEAKGKQRDKRSLFSITEKF